MITAPLLRRHRRVLALSSSALALTLLAGCQTLLGQYGYDAQNTGYNPVETTLNQSNVSGLVAQWVTDLSAIDTVVDAGDPVLTSDGNIALTTDHQVVVVRPDGTVLWNVTIPDAHPEIPGPHIISIYGDENAVAVQVDLKVQGGAPNFVGGYIVKLSNGSGSPVSSVNTFRPAAPLGYAGIDLVKTGEVIDHADYGPGRTITVDMPGNGRRIIRNAVGPVEKPATNGDALALSVGDALYQWTTRCEVAVCDETTAAVTPISAASRPVIVDTTVYVTSYFDRKLYAVGPTGAVLWIGNAGNVPADPAASVAAGKVFVGNTTGIFYGFPLGGCGAPTCSYTYVNSFVDQIEQAPTLANGLAYVMVYGRLVIVRTDCTLIENCSPKKQITLNGPILGSRHQVLVNAGRRSTSTPTTAASGPTPFPDRPGILGAQTPPFGQFRTPERR